MEGLHLDISALIGSLTSGAAVILLAKLYLQRASNDLENVISQMQEVQTHLATVAIRLETLQRLEETIQDHEKKIAVLESLLRK